jgi:hypothetical protein
MSKISKESRKAGKQSQRLFTPELFATINRVTRAVWPWTRERVIGRALIKSKKLRNGDTRLTLQVDVFTSACTYEGPRRDTGLGEARREPELEKS